MTLIQRYQQALSKPLPDICFGRFGSAVLHWVGPLIPGHETLFSGSFDSHWWRALACLLLWLLIIVEVLLARYFLIEYVGDVAAYISPYKDSKFEDIRDKIQRVGLNVGKVIYGFERSGSTVPRYEQVVIAGHSLGSLLAYDTLNALINLDNTADKSDRRDVVRRTRALITFGSPLDKTAFIFRTQIGGHIDWVREQLAASVQPLILDYAQYRPPTFHWINIWSPLDIISGELNYYDDPTATVTNVPPAIINMVDPQARVPIIAHVEYWQNNLLAAQLYRSVL